MSIKINKLEIENVKRVKAVKLEPSQSGLTIVGGNNNQGKTSVLDSIAWALGGAAYKPSKAERDGSVTPPHLHVVLSNGLVVERKGKNSDLKVTDPKGQKAGQQLLDSFVEKLALDLPKFMEASDTEKANTLLNIIGVGSQLKELEQQEKEIYNERLAIGRIADQKAKFAKEQEYFPDAPKDLISASELIQQQQEILARNGENQKKRDRLSEITFEKHRIFDEAQRLEEQIKSLQERLDERKKAYENVVKDEAIAMKTVNELQDESTEELEKSLADIEEINRKVRINLDKDKAEDDAREYQVQYDSLTGKLNDVRKQKTELLNDANLPLPELTVDDGKLLYKGQQWDNMSGSDRLKVATAIVRKLKPDCGFVLMDKLEQMDMITLKEFSEWLEKEDLQVIATRVSTGEECSIIIEDGYAKGSEEKVETKQKEWKEGVF
nr:MAG TPA: STRUCTURAL MAINTENANCE OF CHROMOSOMES PROTEIN [Caudoviricetes sp.]